MKAHSETQSQSLVCKICQQPLDINSAKMWLTAFSTATSLLPKEAIDAVICKCGSYAIGFVKDAIEQGLVCELVYFGNHGVILFNRSKIAHFVKSVSDSFVGWLFGSKIKEYIECDELTTDKATLWLNKAKTYALFQ